HTRFSRDWSSDVCSSDLDDVRGDDHEDETETEQDERNTEFRGRRRIQVPFRERDPQHGEGCREDEDVDGVERLEPGGRDLEVECVDITIDVALRRSEEHTSELQSRENLVCRLLLEKKKHGKPRHDRQSKV